MHTLHSTNSGEDWSHVVSSQLIIIYFEIPKTAVLNGITEQSWKALDQVRSIAQSFHRLVYVKRQ